MIEKNKIQNKFLLSSIVFIITMTFYGLTMSTSVGLVDSGMVVYNSYFLKLGSWVNCHNLFQLIAYLFIQIYPFGETAVKVAVCCGFFGALAVSVMFLAIYEYTRKVFPSIIGALAMAVGHSHWFFSTAIKVYSLNSLAIGLMIYFIIRFIRTDKFMYIYLAVLIFGLICSNHIMMGLTLFAFLGIFLHPSILKKYILKEKIDIDEEHLLNKVKYKVSWNVIIKLCLSFIIGFSLFIYLFFADVLKNYNDAITLSGNSFSIETLFNSFTSILHGASGGKFKELMFNFEKPFNDFKAHYTNYWFLLFMNYPSFHILAGFLGLYFTFIRKKYFTVFLFSFILFIANAIWVMNYFVWDQYAFAIPSFVTFSFFVGTGSYYILILIKRKIENISLRKITSKLAYILCFISLFVGIFLYRNIPDWAKEENGFWNKYFKSVICSNHLYDSVRYFADPIKSDYYDIKKFAEGITKNLPENAILYDDEGKGNYILKCYYQDCLKVREDITYKALYGWGYTDELAQSNAEEIIQSINDGKQCFLSSLCWPENEIVNSIYYLKIGKANNEKYEDIKKLFLGEVLKRLNEYYRFVQYYLNEDKTCFIYKIVTADRPIEELTPEKNRIEGESLEKIKNPENGKLENQYIFRDNMYWSMNCQLFWLDGSVANSVELKMNIKDEGLHEIEGMFAKASDYGIFDILINDKIVIQNLDLFEPTIQLCKIKLGKMYLKKENIIKIVVKNSNSRSFKRNGFGLDYLSIN